MEKLDFNKDEQYLLNYYHSPARSSFTNYLFSYAYYLIPSAFFAGLAIYQNSLGCALVGYALLAFFVLYQLVHAKRFLGVMPRILTKYEARIESLEKELSESKRSM